MKTLTTLLLTLFILTANAQIRVSPTSSGTGDGSSWANATTLESLTVANAPSGTAIWVQAGTYNLSATLLVPQGVRLYGGFAGTEGYLSERNFAENTTVIDAGHQFGAVTLGANALLSGVTVQNGFANTPGRLSGGGVLMQAGSRIEHSHIINNRTAERGGGVFAEGSAEIFNSVIANNKAGIDGFAVSGEAVLFYGNTVVGNALLDAMYLVCDEPHSLTLVSPTATANQVVTIHTPITNIAYLRGGSITVMGITWTGTEDPALPPDGISVATNGVTTTISGMPTVAGTFGFTIATAANACQPVSQSGTIAVTLDEDCFDPHALTLTSATATIAQTVMINTPIENTVFTRGGGAQAAIITWTGTANAATAPAGITVSSLTENPITISGTPSVAGTFGFSIATVANACEPILQTGTIVALTGDEVCEDVHTLTLSSSAGSVAQTVYVNAPISNIIHSRGGGATAAIITWTGTENPTTPPAGITVSSATTNPITISGTPATAGTFGFSIATVANACPSVQLAGTIVAISPDDVCALPHTLTLTSPSATSGQTVDINTAIEDIVFTRGGASTAVAITWSGTSGPTTAPAGITVSTEGIVTTISGTPAVAGTFGFVIATVANACPSVALMGTLAVTLLEDCLAPHTLTLTSNPATIAQTININTALTNTVFTRGGSAEAVIITWTGTEGATTAPEGLTVSTSGVTTTLSGTPTVAGTFGFTIATVANDCAPVILTGVIVVMMGDEVCEDAHSLTLISGAGSNIQTLLINTPITNIVYARGGDATAAIVTWTGTANASTPPAGISVSSSTTAPIVISGAPSVAGTFSFTVSTVGNACESVQQTGTIIALTGDEECIIPHSLIRSTPSGSGSQTVDINTAIENINFLRGGGSTAKSVTWTGTANPTTPPAGITVSIMPNGVTTVISGTPTVAGTYGFTVATVANACAPVTLSGMIAVTLLDDCLAPHTLTLSSAPATVAQTVHTHTAITPIAYTRGGSAEAVIITWTGTADAATPPAGLTVSSLTANPITISGTPAVAGTFGFTIATVANACEPATQSGVIVVMTGDEICENPHFLLLSNPTMSGAPFSPTPNVQTVLVNTPIANIGYTFGGDATAATVTWTGTANAVTPPAGITVSNWIGTQSTGPGDVSVPILISGTPTVTGTFGFTVSTLANACEPAVQTGTILVLSPDDDCINPHTITLVSPRVTANQVIDLGESITNIAYMRGGGVTAVHVSWTNTAGPSTPPAGITVSTVGVTTTISGTPTVEGLFEFTVFSVADACPSVGLSGSIAVGDICQNPHTLALTSPAGTDNQNACINVPIDNIVFTRGGGASEVFVSWTGTADEATAPAGLTVSSLTASQITISGTPTATGTFGFTISTIANACPSISLSGTITVHTTPAAPTPAHSDRCGTGAVEISAASAGNQIQWFAAATGGTPLTTGTPNTGVTASAAIWATPSISSTTTFYAQTITPQGCVSASRTAVIATVKAIPAAPTGSPNARCGAGTLTISATSAGNQIQWFAAATGGSPLTTGTPATGVTGSGANWTTPSISTTTTYHAQTITPQGCVSATRTSVVATVNAIPAAPTGTPNSRCGAGTLTISATSAGNQIQWFAAATGGTPLTTGTPNTGVTASAAIWATPSISSTTTFYAQTITPQGCTSAARTSVVATVNAIPTVTGTTPNARCGTGTVALSATVSAGANARWFSAQTGGTALHTGTSFTTPSISATTTYWVEAHNATTGCTSAARTSVVATVNAIPTVTGTTPNARCGAGTVALSATVSAGANARWFSAQTGGTALHTGTSFTTPSISATTTYWVEAHNATTGCTSAARTSVVATVNAIPTVTGTTPAARCGAGTVALSATVSAGANARWFSAQTGGTALHTGTSFTTPSISATTTYWVEAHNATTGCTSAARTSVVATVSSPHTLARTSAEFSTRQIVYQNSQIANITFTRGGGATGATIAWTGTANAATAPAGITVTGLTSTSITISGAPTAVGNFGFTLTTTPATPCTPVTQTGTITVRTPPIVVSCDNATPTWGAGALGGSFATAQTWVVGTGANQQEWSDAVVATACANVSTWTPVHAPPFNAACRNSALNANFSGHYFSWCAVMRFRDQLCPPAQGWRVPSREDFELLFENLGLGVGGGPSSAENILMGAVMGPNGGIWGGARLAGYANNPAVQVTVYTSSTSVSDTNRGDINFGEWHSTIGTSVKGAGVALRCVR